MSPGELTEAIVYPAQAAGLDIEPGLVGILLRDLGTAPQGNADLPAVMRQRGFRCSPMPCRPSGSSGTAAC